MWRPTRRATWISATSAVGDGTHLNPQWSADDRDLYFVGDVDGTANVLRVDLESSAVRRVTNVSTGVSGITPTGPALSVSADGSTLAFTVYKNGRPRLVVLDRDEADANERAGSAFATSGLRRDTH